MVKITNRKGVFWFSILVACTLVGYFSWQRIKPTTSNLYSLELVQNTDALVSYEKPDEPRVIIVNFWASWCPPCIQETPSLLQFAKAHRDKLKLYLVSEDSTSKDIREFLKAYVDLRNVNLKVIWDANRQIGENFKVQKMPETFVFDKQGHLIRQISGSVDWDSPDIQNLITSHF